MGFVEALKICLVEKLLTTEGRARRAEYWWFFLFSLLITGAMGIYGFQAASSGAEINPTGLPEGPLTLVVMVIGLALMVPTWTVAVRRMHDRGRTGLWIAPIFGWNLINSLLQLHAQVTGDYGLLVAAAMPIGIVAMAAGLGSVIMLIYFCFRGTEGPNRYGPDPLGAQTDAEIFA